MGVDRDDQPAYVARFGEHRFLLSDALDRARLKDLISRFHPMGILSSPPCEGSSTATFAGAPSHEARLISQTREMLRGTGLPFVIENVEGARAELSAEAVKLYGQMFGLRVNRPRLFECGGDMSLHVDAALLEGSALAARCCLGSRARYPRLDPFGRAVRQACCSGNVYAVQGSSPMGGSASDMAAAMGLDPAHFFFLRRTGTCNKGTCNEGTCNVQAHGDTRRDRAHTDRHTGQGQQWTPNGRSDMRLRVSRSKLRAALGIRRAGTSERRAGLRSAPWPPP